ncbi:MAG: ATP synthase F1 subunit delta [Gemmatimonadetes bacterium]|nr:MAG: ATP synthase F1 subunit delta [Gemmatimonadota bacterium]
MRDETVARNYAETLFELAQRHEGVEVYQAGIEAVARLIDENPDVRTFFETPRISGAEKKAVIRRAFGEALPKHLVNFLQITIDKRRQRLLRDIARAYHALVDEHMNRVHVEVTLARELPEDAIEELKAVLGRMLGREAIPHVRIKPQILGGVVVRAGDTIYDGSLRRRLDGMRRRLLHADLPSAAEA